MNNFGTAFNVAHIEEGSYIYGPGRRFVIWFQGCSLHCKGCWNTSMWSFDPNLVYEREDLLKQILSGSYDGVTFLGGEPLQQPENLLWLIRSLKTAKVHCMLYTGYEPEEISENPLFQEICSLPEILISGRYHEDERSTFLKWRGSKNQKILIQDGKEYDISDSNDVEVVLNPDGSICYLGYPDTELTTSCNKER